MPVASCRGAGGIALGPLPGLTCCPELHQEDSGAAGLCLALGLGAVAEGRGGGSREIHGKPLSWGFHLRMETSQWPLFHC